MKKYQGEDIYFSLNFNPLEGNDILNFNDLENIIVYAYTTPNNIVKFSKLNKSGYSPLVDVNGDGMILNGNINSQQTKLMNGQIMLDIMCTRVSEVGDLKENLIQKAASGIFITSALIKEEV